MSQITTVIVTYNRKTLLIRCLTAVTAQTCKPDRIIIVNNASTDGTLDLLQSEGWLSRPDVIFISMGENTGGAGGFAAGLKYATETGANWVWMMDDDAEPHHDALEHLAARQLIPENIYGSVAVFDGKLSWPMMPFGGGKKDSINTVEQLADEVDVKFIPFLGILISAAMVKRIGLPDAGFFLAADDVEYCTRARKAGAKIILIGNSRLNHPASERYRLWLPGFEFFSLKLPPWKRYYDVRNRLFIARAHYGLKLWYSTIPGSFFRLIATLWHEGNRWLQIKAFLAGMTDGLLGKKGKRHEKWGIK